MKGLLVIASLLSLAAAAWASETPGEKVELTWSAPASSSDPVAGYDIYRAERGSGAWMKLNDAPVTTTAYTDDNVELGMAYTYYVVSVDARGNQSAPSEPWSVTIPGQPADEQWRWTVMGALLVVVIVSMAGLIAVWFYIARLGQVGPILRPKS